MGNEDEWLKAAITASIAGASEIMEVYGNEFEVEFKEDKSPLTLADRRAHDAISKVLATTGLPVLSEEGKNIPYEVRRNWDKFWMVDPLDGTKEFVKRNGEFTVNIALIADNRAVMGVILVPVTGLLYFASHARGAFKIALNGTSVPEMEEMFKIAESLPSQPLPSTTTVVCSRSHLSPETSDFIDNLRKTEPALEFVSIGSSLKMCLVAEGQAHIYPRFGPTMEWDTAAGQAILEIAGGHIKRVDDGKMMLYNKPDLLNPWFIASRPE